MTSVRMPLRTSRIPVLLPYGGMSISEAVFSLPNGGVCRLGTITVHSDIVHPARFGDHYHPDTEMFEVVAGSVWLYTANPESPAAFVAQPIRAGYSVVVPAGVVHTFVCRPGTVLHSVANAPFDDKWIVPCQLPLLTD